MSQIYGLNNGHWLFPKQMGEGIGFIYLIHDLYMDRFYLGKKLYKSLRGLKKGKETDWRIYKTSSPIMKVHFTARPKSEFKFICLEEYKTKSGLSFAETWTLCHVQAPLSDRFYNKRIEAISFKVLEAVTERHMRRLSTILGDWNK